MSATTTRRTAEERREAVLEVARREFSQHGVHGASTDAIARAAGISQPYLFRLFGTKKQLYLDVTEQCFARMLDVFREAASGTSGEAALDAIGDAYTRVIEEDRTMLQGQLQAYAAAVDDEDVREIVVRGFGRLVDYAETVSGLDSATVSSFFATGMLLNVLAAMNVVAGEGSREPWVTRISDGCRAGLPHS
jgi:AcrR family transcriptional regulator